VVNPPRGPAVTLPARVAAFTEHQPSRLLLPYLPFLLAFGTAMVLFVIRGGQVEPTLYVLSTVLVVLVVGRQLVTLNDNRTLTQRLGSPAARSGMPPDRGV
jgi:hypothetical protein